MTDGWRNRYMAPFYALIISFALVLLLGTVLEKSTAGPPAEPKSTPTTQAPPDDPATARPEVVFVGAKRFPGEELTLVHGDEQTALGDLGDLPELPIDDRYAICAILDNGWVAVDAVQVPRSRFSCWGPFDVKSDKPSVLRAKKSE